ncbi:lasso peptide biosynthesis B2 protein [Streptomyces cathayae]|uniref:Lasso peptide biosynthesis B2 protein n=1 Tax=Streptomyces cathayae TaxID=3031124 RepID=A0ABY8JW46_9ACTN|nr:lasso peptide biosynthesis B2 protein [Streptomyces sp. HUAS 5]WGD40219.1 lasso peptide biosynthesis B2 protein [Streptomyces sp. HUAS 5]
MSMALALKRDRRKRPLGLRVRTRAAIIAARLLVFLPPHRLRRVMGAFRRGAEPATVEQATAARESVLAASLALNGLRACLPRSVSVALLCRLLGVWPTWCVGTRTAPPFAAHAWVEAEGRLVGEQGVYNAYARLMSVPPLVSPEPADAAGVR